MIVGRRRPPVTCYFTHQLISLQSGTKHVTGKERSRYNRATIFSHSAALFTSVSIQTSCTITQAVYKHERVESSTISPISSHVPPLQLTVPLIPRPHRALVSWAVDARRRFVPTPCQCLSGVHQSGRARGWYLSPSGEL